MKEKDKTKERLINEMSELQKTNAELDEAESEHKPTKSKEDEKYMAILHNLPDIVYEIDPEGYFTFISNSVKILGYYPDELIGKHFSKILHPDDVKLFSRNFVLQRYQGKTTGDKKAPKLFDERRTGERQTKNLEIRLIPKTQKEEVVGTVIAFGDVISTGHYDTDVSSENKKFLGTLGVIRDITERKRMEEAMRESEKRYRTLTENVTVGIYRNTIGPKGSFIEANPAIVKMFGYESKDEFLSINVSDLYQNPEDRKQFNEKMLKHGFVKDEELRLKKKDGTQFFGSVSAVAVKDENGNVKYYDGIIEDITESKRAMRALQESEEKFRLIFENAKDAIFWADLDTGVIINCNKAAEVLLEKSKEEIIGTHQTALHPPLKTEYYTKMFEKHVAQKGAVDEEAEVILKSGRIIPVAITASVTVVGGKPIIQSIFHDITERKRAETELRILATTDALTGVLNRGTGLLLLGRQLQLARRNNYKLSVCYVDVNGLKEINDTYGHQEGDEALKFICKLLKKILRAVDIICRLGGDEFLLVLPQCSMREVVIVWQRIVREVAIFNTSQIKPYTLNLSRGFAEFEPNEDKSVDQLIAIADQEMYKHKQSLSVKE